MKRGLLALLAMFAMHVEAEENIPANAESDVLQPIDVVGHYDNGVGTSNAASQGVILGSLLQDSPLQRPGEVLEAVPGLVVTQHSGEGKANQYFLRGYNLDHGTDFATSVDGVPVNMPTNGHGQGYTDLNFLIPELVERIDYRKGPYFAQNGDFASAGSADIAYRDSLPSTLLSMTAGEYDYRRVLAASSIDVDATSTTHALGALEMMREDGPWVNPDGMRKVNTLLRVSGGDWQRGWSADAVAYAAHWTSTDQVPLELLETNQLCRFCSLDPSDGGRSARQIVSAEWHTHDSDGYEKNSVYFQHYRLQLWSDFTYFENDPMHGDQFNQRDARNIEGIDVSKGWNHDVFGAASTTEVGVHVRRDFIHVSLLNTEKRIPLSTVSDNLVDEVEGAMYIQNATTWLTWFRTLIGVRDDGVNMRLTSQTYPINSGHKTDARVSPKLSLVFGPWARTEFFANVGNGLHSNDARGVIYRSDPSTGEPLDRAPALVGTFGKEVGLRTEVVPNLQSSLSVWQLDSASELVYSADSGGTEINGASRRYGVELNSHYVLNEWLLFDTAFASTHSRYATNNDNGESGNHIPNAVGRVATVGLSIHDVGPWYGDIKLRYIGPYPLSQDGLLRAPSAFTTNLRIGRRLNASTSLSVDVLNVFDRKFADIAYEQSYRASPELPIVPNGTTLHPGEPRQLRLTLRLQLQ